MSDIKSSDTDDICFTFAIVVGIESNILLFLLILKYSWYKLTVKLLKIDIEKGFT